MSNLGEQLIKATLKRDNRIGIQRLIDRGASVNYRDGDGCTPLYHACYIADAENIQVLLANGADVNAQSTPTRISALQILIYTNPSMKCVQKLLDVGANVDYHDMRGYTALFLAFRYNAPTQIIELLIRNGACITGVNTIGYLLWRVQCMHDNVERVQRLVRLGLSPNVRSPYDPHISVMDMTFIYNAPRVRSYLIEVLEIVE